jgi:lysine 2,3-aminomutase
MTEKKYKNSNLNNSSTISVVSEMVMESLEEPPLVETIDKERQKKQNISDSSKEFIKKHFPNTTIEQWNDWKWQYKNSITTTEQLQKFLHLSESETIKEDNVEKYLPLRITPYYLSLLDDFDASQPLRKTVIPSVNEYYIGKDEVLDPLCEHGDSPIPNLVHRYPDRVLFLVSNTCSVYCRYCTRSHMVAKDCKEIFNDFEPAFKYIEENPQIRDVLLSGGDPLLLSDGKLEYFLRRLRAIPHVEIIRIGTKVPVVLPQRITDNLVNMLKKYHPLFMSIHFTHPDELTEECKEACLKLADAGIPLGSQTVLLKNINDDIIVIKELFHNLLKIRVKPYYLYQCDLIPGSSHFRTPIKTGLNIMEKLRGFTSGYAMPYFVVDAPGGGGKIPLLPEYCLGKKDGNIILRNYENKEFKYPDNI